jgi:elongation factor G
VLCAVGGVQSQTMTVDRQMKRYNVPRLVFINKMDRAGAAPFRGTEQLRTKLRLNAALLHLPIGTEATFQGIIDLVGQYAIYFDDGEGSQSRRGDIPLPLLAAVAEKRHELVAAVADVDEEVGDLFLNEIVPSEDVLRAAVRRSTIARTFVPVLMGAAFKNKGVQTLLDSVVQYLPSPKEVQNSALDLTKKEESVPLASTENAPFVGLAFKLEESRFGQLTYMRVYQGTLKKGGFIANARTERKIKVPRLVRMHANQMEVRREIELCACSSFRHEPLCMLQFSGNAMQ